MRVNKTDFLKLLVVPFEDQQHYTVHTAYSYQMKFIPSSITQSNVAQNWDCTTTTCTNQNLKKYEHTKHRKQFANNSESPATVHQFLHLIDASHSPVSGLRTKEMRLALQSA